MNELTTSGAGTPQDDLHAELRALIAASRQRLAGAVNAELTRLYWTVGQRLATEVLGGERAQYGGRTVARLGQRLAEEFGRGFEAKNLRRMVQFAQAFADPEKVASLMRQLSWTHFLQLIPVKTEAARWFYAQQCVEARWGVRELHRQIVQGLRAQRDRQCPGNRPAAIRRNDACAGLQRPVLSGLSGAAPRP